MEAVGTWPRPTIAISGRCFRMMEMPVWREFVFQRTSNEPIVRPRMSMCRIASWSVSMIRQLMRFIPPLFYESEDLDGRATLPGCGATLSDARDFDQPSCNGCLASVDRRYILNPKTRKRHGINIHIGPLAYRRDSGVVYRKAY